MPASSSSDYPKDSLSLKGKTKNKFNQLLYLGQGRNPLSLKQSRLIKIDNDETALIGSDRTTLSAENKLEGEKKADEETVSLKAQADAQKSEKKKRRKFKSKTDSDLEMSENKISEQPMELQNFYTNAKKGQKEDTVIGSEIKKHDHILESRHPPLPRNEEGKNLNLQPTQSVPTNQSEKVTTDIQKQSEIKENKSKLESGLAATGKEIEPKYHDSEKVNVLATAQQSSNEYLTSSVTENEPVLAILIHDCDPLQITNILNKLVVKIHVIDENTGNYIKKSTRQRRVTSFYETSNLEYILPVITKPSNVKEQGNLNPSWDEVIIFNESFDYIMNESVIVFFEILDLDANSDQAYFRKSDKGWKNVAWAFLKIKGANGITNTGKKLMLQLYKYKSKVLLRESTDVYQLWKSRSKSMYKASIRVTIKTILPPSDLPCNMRSMYPTQQEKGNIDVLKNVAEKSSASTKNLDGKTIWMRLPTQPCRIPMKLDVTVKPCSKGCLVISFSFNGRLLACGCHNELGYPIVLYSIPGGEYKMEFSGHTGLIYDLNWTKDDNYLLSASADCTVQVWDTKDFKKVPRTVLPHPSFVYCVNFHSVVQTIISSGCNDGVVRVWTIKQMNTPHNGVLVQELEGHRSNVNSLCFGDEGNKLYSADGIGVIIIWNAYFTEQPSKKGVSRDWSIFKVIDMPELKGLCINKVLLHPKCHHKLLIHTRNNSIKMYDLRSSTINARYEGFINYQEFIRCCVSPCGTFVFSGSEDGTVCVWSCDIGDQVTVYTNLPFQSSVSNVCFHPRDNIVAFCSKEDNSSVLIYSYDYNSNGTSLNETYWSNDTSQNEITNTDKVQLSSAKKHVSFDMDVEKSVRVKQAIKKMDSVLDCSSTNQNEQVSPFCAAKQNEQVSPSLQDQSSKLISSFVGRSPSPSFVSPHSFTIPEIAAEFQRQLLNQSKNINEKQKMTVSLSGKVRTPSFKFQVPSLKRDEEMLLVKALHSYNAARTDELSFTAGESIKVLYKDSETWWIGKKESNGDQGFFPVNYVTQNLKTKTPGVLD